MHRAGLLVSLLAVHIWTCTCELPASPKCQPLDIKVCKILGYNRSRPVQDIYRNTRRSELSGYIHFLEGTQCARDVLFFMCMMYSPPCFEGIAERVYPCRPVCEKVKAGCLGVVKKFHFEWPSELDCQKLPDHNTGVCIRPSAIVKRHKDTSEDTCRKDVKNTVDQNLSGSLASVCKPCRPTKKLKRYRQFKKASYAFQGVYHSRETTADGKTKLTFIVGRVFRQRKARIGPGRVILWVDSLCLCPKLEFDKSYIILGHEDKKKSIMKFNWKTLVVSDSYYWRNRLAKWQAKFRMIWRKRQRKKLSMFNYSGLNLPTKFRLTSLTLSRDNLRPSG